MNRELIKHIVVTELRWKSKSLLKAFLLCFITLILYKLSGEDEELNFFFIIFGILIPFVLAFSSSILGLANLQASQSGAFSWKYLHTVIHDRGFFIIGYCLAGMACTVPVLLTGLLATLITKIPTSLYFISLVPFLLLVTFLRLVAIRNVIHFPRKTYYRYNDDSVFIRWIKDFFIGLNKVFHFGALIGCLILLTSLAGGFGRIYGIVAASVGVFILLKMTYEHTLLIWADERFSQWIPKREAKKTSIYFLSCIALFAMNVHLHGPIFKDQGEIFDTIKEGNVADLKKMRINAEVLKYKNNSNLTPLFYAIETGNKKAVVYLLDQGAEKETTLKGSFKKYKSYFKGMTPLLFAIDSSQSEIVDILLERGANVEAKNHYGVGALSFASFRCNLPLMKKLTNKGANINSVSKTGLSPLHYASQGNGCLSSILYLEKLGADKELKNNEGETYLEYAKETNPIFYEEFMFYKENLAN